MHEGKPVEDPYLAACRRVLLETIGVGLYFAMRAISELQSTLKVQKRLDAAAPLPASASLRADAATQAAAFDDFVHSARITQMNRNEHVHCHTCTSGKCGKFFCRMACWRPHPVPMTTIAQLRLLGAVC